MPQSYYVAPIALTEDLVKGATVSGTINGVQVSGTVGAGHVVLYAIAQVSPYERLLVADIGGDAGNYQIVLEKQPESDLTIHLTQAIPAHVVTIPEEYLELTEMNAAIETAQSTANAAQSTANTALSTANTARTKAENAKTAADQANSEIRTKDLWFHSSETSLDDPNVPYGIKIGSVGSSKEHPRVILTIGDGLTMCGSSLNPNKRHVQVKVQHESKTRFGCIYVSSEQGYSATITPTEISAAYADATINSLYCLNGITLKSTTSGSTKKFRITVDDTGTLSATEVTT